MKSDVELRRDIEAELRFRPDIDERDIAVTVHDSIVTLTGFAKSFLDKQRAEDAAKRVSGVCGVANDIEVRPGNGTAPTDPEIAHAAVEAIRAQMPDLSESIKVLVHHGHIRLEGKVEWHFQRKQAEDAVRWLRGVTELTDAIAVRPIAEPTEIKQRIERAFRRSAQIDADRVTIETQGSEVILRGRVRSWSEREQAQDMAWSAPGVTQVRNEITVSVV